MRSSSSGIKVHVHNHDQTSFLGLFLFAVSTLFLTLMSATAKLLAKRGMPVFEIVLGRSFFMTLCCVPAFMYQRVDPRGHRQALLTLRGCFGCERQQHLLGGVAAAAEHPDAAVLPGAAVRRAQRTGGPWGSTLPACAGGGAGAEISASALPILGIMIGCLQAVFSAGAKLTVRALRTSNSSLVIVFWMSGLSSILAGLACKLLPNHWILPRDREDWLLLLATGVAAGRTGAVATPLRWPRFAAGNAQLPGGDVVDARAGFAKESPGSLGEGLFAQHRRAGNVSMTAGLMRAQAVPAMVLSYLSIVWGIALGVVMFDEHPNLSSLAGSLLICSCTLILSVHEVRRPALHPVLLAAGDPEAAEPLLGRK
ncbi:MAG: hypothetical protein WDW36_008169 [Sanguina aurantia]